jgi:LPS export ABC transporter protein LptC
MTAPAQRFSVGILAGVLVFLAAVVLVMVARGRGDRADTPEPVETRADYRIKEVDLREESRHGVRWHLRADHAEVFDSSGVSTTVMQHVRVTIEDKERTWTLSADEGTLVQEKKDVVLRGQVTLSSSDGLRVETATLRWNGESERAWTDDPVIIYRAGAVVNGQGMEVRMPERSAEIKGRVRATFTRTPERS